MSTAARVAVAGAAGNALLAAPAFAEAGKIFDFNLTLPLMAGQFLVLMVVLDKLVYSPVGKVLDDRDAQLRSKLEAVKDNSSDLAKYAVRAPQRTPNFAQQDLAAGVAQPCAAPCAHRVALRTRRCDRLARAPPGQRCRGGAAAASRSARVSRAPEPRRPCLHRRKPLASRRSMRT